MTIDERYSVLQRSLAQIRAQLYALTQQEIAILNQMGLCEAIFKDRAKTEPPEKEKPSAMDEKLPSEKKTKKNDSTL